MTFLLKKPKFWVARIKSVSGHMFLRTMFRNIVSWGKHMGELHETPCKINKRRSINFECF